MIESGSFIDLCFRDFWRGLSKPTCSAVIKRRFSVGKTRPDSISPTVKQMGSFVLRNSVQLFRRVGTMLRPRSNSEITSFLPGDDVTRSVLYFFSVSIQRESGSLVVFLMILKG